MRIVVAGVLADSMVRFRGHMLRRMVENGHEVLAMAPEDSAAVRADLAALGVMYRVAPLRRAGMNPLRDLQSLVALALAFRAFRADAVLVYAAKPVIYGLIAARLAGVGRRAAMITGTGSALAGGAGPKRWVLSALMRAMYRISVRQAHIVFFQNPDDQRLFRRLGLVRRRQRVVRIRGSGVDLDAYAPTPLPGSPITFLMVARLLRDKGVTEFVEAARVVRRSRPEIRLQLLGPLDPNPSAISGSDLASWREEGAIEYLGETRDVRPYLAQAHVCVLPSYGEGTPRSVLEAMAMGRPILTTDVPGCRETVVEGRNGHLVPARDAPALADAMLRMATQPERLAEMGRESRALAEERFDVHVVNRVILEAMGLARVQAPGNGIPERR